MSQKLKLSPSNVELIESIVTNIEKGTKLLKTILPKLAKVKGSRIPPGMSNEDILSAWEVLNIPEKKVFDRFLSMLSKKNKMEMIKSIAKTDLSFKEGFKLGGDGDGKMVPYNNDDIEEVPQGNKKLFFYANFIGSLMSLILGIVILHLVSENIQAFNVEYELNITLKELITNFKGTVEYMPIAVLGAVTREATNVMRFKILNGCGALSGNTATSLLYSFFGSSDSSACMAGQTVDAITEVAKMNTAKVTTMLNMSWTLSSAGITLITGATTNLGRLLLNKETPLQITNGDEVNGDEQLAIEGGKRKSKRIRKSKKSRKSKKGRKGRKSRKSRKSRRNK